MLRSVLKDVELLNDQGWLVGMKLIQELSTLKPVLSLYQICQISIIYEIDHI